MSHKIYIFDSFARNIGDVGILISTIDGIRASTVHPDISIESSHPLEITKYPELADCEVFPKIYNIDPNSIQGGRIAHILVGLYDLFSFLVWATMKYIRIPTGTFPVRPSRTAQASAMYSSAIFVSSGGGFLSTNYKYYQLRVYTYLIGWLLRKKVYLFGQSIGPFDTVASRFIIPSALNTVTAIAVREPASLEYLKVFRIKTKIYGTADIAFTLNSPKQSEKKRRVAICVKEIADSDSAQRYLKSIKMAIEHLKGKAFEVAIVSQVADDDPLARGLAKEADVEYVPFGVHPKDLKAFYGQCTAVIASRMHACLFTACAGTPFIAISYEQKFAGMFEQLEYSKKFLLFEKDLTPEKLNSAIDCLLGSLAPIQAGLRFGVTKMQPLAQENIDIMNNLIS